MRVGPPLAAPLTSSTTTGAAAAGREGGAAADADQQVYLSPTTGLPRGIFNNSLIQDAEVKNKWKVNKDPAATIEDSEMQKTVEPPDHDTPLKAAYKPAVSPKQANRRQIIKRSPYTNTYLFVEIRFKFIVW